MKKKFGIIALLMILTLTGCGGKNQEDEFTQMTQNNLMEESKAPEATSTPVPTDAIVPTAHATQTPAPEAESEVYVISFEANTIEGEAWNSDKIENSKLTMVNVWATYCNPCLSEMPDLGELAAEYDTSEFQLIGIVSDVLEGDKVETMDYARNLIEETQAEYPHLLLNESLYINLVGAVDAVPMTFFFNEERELLGYVTGAKSKEVWKNLIDRLLAEME